MAGMFSNTLFFCCFLQHVFKCSQSSDPMPTVLDTTPLFSEGFASGHKLRGLKHLSGGITGLGRCLNPDLYLSPLMRSSNKSLRFFLLFHPEISGIFISQPSCIAGIIISLFRMNLPAFLCILFLFFFHSKPIF